MKSVNNKIDKPFIKIGFNKKGKISYNIDLNKTKKLSDVNLHELQFAIKKIVDSVNIFKNENKLIDSRNNYISDMSNFYEFIEDDVKIKTKKVEQSLNCIKKFSDLFKIKVPLYVTLDALIDVEVGIKNNKKLYAVKAFKEASGLGLKNSKDFVDWYANELNIKFEYFK